MVEGEYRKVSDPDPEILVGSGPGLSVDLMSLIRTRSNFKTLMQKFCIKTYLITIVECVIYFLLGYFHILSSFYVELLI